MFTDKTLLITGGTGSFGNAVLRRFLQSNLKEIRIFSRDEKKQDDMRKRYNSPKLKFYIGDVRDRRSVEQAMRGVDYVFHAAALKQVPSCEFHPMQAVRTNVLGTENVLEAAIAAGVKRVVCLSVSHQCHGYQQSHDGKGHGCYQSQLGMHQHRHLWDSLWQRDGVARLGDSAFCRAGAGGQAHYRHRPGHDTLHDDSGRCGGPSAVCV
jgi:nucleoside-diphosphate-sugar epimerase